MMFDYIDLIESAHMVGFLDPKTGSVGQVIGSDGLKNGYKGVQSAPVGEGNGKNG